MSISSPIPRLDKTHRFGVELGGIDVGEVQGITGLGSSMANRVAGFNTMPVHNSTKNMELPVWELYHESKMRHPFAVPSMTKS